MMLGRVSALAQKLAEAMVSSKGFLPSKATPNRTVTIISAVDALGFK